MKNAEKGAATRPYCIHFSAAKQKKRAILAEFQCCRDCNRALCGPGTAALSAGQLGMRPDMMTFSERAVGG